MSILDQLAQKRANGHTALPSDPQSEKDLPNLWECLTRGAGPPPEGRIPSEFTVTRGAGAFEVTFKDHESELQFTLQLEQLGTLLEALELALGDAKTVWRSFESYKLKKKPKPKKKEGG